MLATYAFYKTFIDENSAVIDFSNWIACFIDSHDGKIRKATTDLLHTFGYHELNDRITVLVSAALGNLEYDEERLYKFYDTFWLFTQIETLAFVQKWINSLEIETTDFEKIDYSYDGNEFVWAPDNIKLLRHFWTHNVPLCREAIRLALEQMFRQPSTIPETLKHLKEAFAFQRHDQRLGFSRQLHLLQLLTDSAVGERNSQISNQLFLSVVQMFLGWEYTEIEGGENGMIVYRFHLRKSDELMKLRATILERLFSLFENNEHSVLSILGKYAWTSNDIDSSIYSDEQTLVQEFIEHFLSPTNYSHCVFVHRYLKTLKKHSIKPSNERSAFLDADSMTIAKIFSAKYDEERLGYEEREKEQKARIKSYLEGKDINFIKGLLASLDSIYIEALAQKDEYWLRSSLATVFQLLAETNNKLYYDSLELIKLGEFSFDLAHGNIIHYPMVNKLIVPGELYKVLNNTEYKEKQQWKAMFFGALSEEQIDQNTFREFIDFLLSAYEPFHLYDVS